MTNQPSFNMAPIASEADATLASSIPTANSNQNQQTKLGESQKYLTKCRSLYSCIYCRTHLADHDQLVSRSFQGNHGRAYLFNSVINVSCGVAVQRELNTGAHAVADISCAYCKTMLGWKYEKAYVETQKYKEGKYIIELAHVVRENRHLELDRSEELFARLEAGNKAVRIGKVAATSDRLRSQQTPPSPSQGSCSSPGYSYSSNEEIDADDELMFPFYDDFICSNRSSFQGNISSSQHNKLRRSLYLDSTPYDWKYSASSPSSSPSSSSSSSDNGQQVSSQHSKKQELKVGPTASLDSSDQSPSTSSYSPQSSSSSSGDNNLLEQQQQQQKSYHGDSNKCQSRSNYYKQAQNNSRPNEDDDDYTAADKAYDNDETQFNFEADKSDDDDDDDDVDVHVDNNEHHKHSDNYETNMIEFGSNCFNQMMNICGQSKNLQQVERQMNDKVDSSKASPNSINLDEEEFYDCYTEHEISGLVMEF